MEWVNIMPWMTLLVMTKSFKRILCRMMSTELARKLQYQMKFVIKLW